MYEMGGGAPIQGGPQVQGNAPAAPQQQTQKAAEKAQPERVTKEQFLQHKKEVKLAPTNVNALTQLNSKDQMLLMRMGQQQGFVGKLAQNLSGMKAYGEDSLPKSMIGAGQSSPPAAMRAAAAATGRVFAGRMMEVRVGKQTTEIFFKLGGKSFTATVATPKKKGSLSHDNDDDEQDLEVIDEIEDVD
ncbi:MAG: hypothetical protein H7338_15180 [Candidatus Sericytochromatia bacterium]|nr:hypothetical protein [Candidatus Sericytochromatia bacterium]